MSRHRNSEKLNIFENIEAGDGFGHQKSQFFFAGANFIASRRRGSYSKCLVEWLHRREKPRQVRLPNRMVMRRWYVFGVRRRPAVLKTYNLENRQDRSTPICYGLVLSCSYGSPLRSKKVIRNQARRVTTPEFRKTQIFRKYWSWWQVWLPKITIFLRWREFHCFAALRLIFQVSRRVVTP